LSRVAGKTTLRGSPELRQETLEDHQSGKTEVNGFGHDEAEKVRRKNTLYGNIRVE